MKHNKIFKHSFFTPLTVSLSHPLKKVKLKKFSIFLFLPPILSGCYITNNTPAPITDINEKKTTTQVAKTTKPEDSISSSSYPLPEPPKIETTSSYSISPPVSSTSLPTEMIVTPDSEIILAANQSALASPQLNENQPKGIASNSPLIVKTTKINYVVREGEPNWQKMAINAIKTMVQSDATLKNLSGNLYVNSVSNQSNTTLPVYVIDQLIMQASQEHSPFSVASQAKINEARSSLNIPPNDTLITTSKSLAIAKAMNAPYILFSTITGEKDSTILTVQLIDTSSAEILAQGESPVAF